jgi:acyl phosphate:glycerol-3-phosphate acyltransferase
MICLVWIATGLLLGSLPFSYWIGRIFLRKDIRSFGDGAPGASNVARAGNIALSVASALLDALKGTAPVYFAQTISGIEGWQLAAVAVAPVIGHAFTPFLRFKGGMGVATTYGVWLGLTGLLGPILIGAGAGFMFAAQKNWVWASIGGMVTLLVFLLLVEYPLNLVGICVAQGVIQAGKRYNYFKRWPEMQPWLDKVSGHHAGQ